MRIALVLAAFAFSAVTTIPEPSDAAKRGYRTAKKAKVARAPLRRPASIASNGLCQRDTGTPTSQLNFRNRCDTEEFWQRTQELGRGRF